MAQNYVCDVCGQVAADFMVTSIADGRTVAVGVECLLEWAMPIAQAFAEAVDAREAAADAADSPAEPAEGEWEAGYPQGRPEAVSGPQEGAERPEDVEGSEVPAADVHR